MKKETIGKVTPAVIGLALLLSACGPDGKEANNEEPVVRPVKALTIKQSEGRGSQTYPARVLPAQEAALSFRISGQILEFPIRAALEVAKDDVIAKLDTRDLETQKLQLESQLQQAEAQLASMTRGARDEDIASLSAAVKASQAQLEAAQQQLERTRTLFDKGLVTKAQLDQHVTSLKVAEADLESRQQELNKGLAGSRVEEVEAQKAAIKALEAQIQAANNNLDDAVLRAPFAGIIANTAVENFANVQAKETIATLQRINRLDLEFDVPGTDVVRFSKEDNPVIMAQLDSVPNLRFNATFVEFDTQADTATQTFRARVSIEPPKDFTILPGMTGEIKAIARSRQKPVIRVPLAALSSSPDGKAFVWLVDKDNKVVQRMVTTGKATASAVIVSEGLEEGETIAIAGLSALQEGMTVKPVAIVGE